MPAVSSSAMTYVEYRDHSEELDIVLTSGRLYTYYGVPRDIYESILRASSKGQFYNVHIRDIFTDYP